MHTYFFTVFTPTFNRIKTLPCVYECLSKQTFRDFEWLIIDDGSSDLTEEMVKKWQKEADFCIRYFYQDNQGKHIAFNNGVVKANGKLFLPLDSDDSCVPNALEIFKEHWYSIPEEKRDTFSGATGLCMNEKGELIGNRFPADQFISNSLDCFYKYKIRGEKWGFQRTDILRQYKFPNTNEQLSFYPESWLWNQIARKYHTLYFNKIVRIYSSHEGSQLTTTFNNSVFNANLLLNKTIIEKDIDYFFYDIGYFLKSLINIYRFSLLSGKSIISNMISIKNPIIILISLFILPLSFFLFFYLKLTRK